jgi:type III secretion protein T
MENLFASLKGLETLVLASALATARIVGLVALMPLFSRTRLAGILRTGVALALALPVIPMTVDIAGRGHVDPPMMLMLVLKEVVIGALLGFVLGIPFWAAEAAGNIVDLQRGSTMGTLIDPMMTHETSATGTLLMIVMVGIYLAAGGLHHTLSALYDSYALWAIDSLSPIFSRDAGAILLTLLTRILGMALTLVAPLIVSLLLSDVVLAFLARASPHLNIFALSLVVKTLVFSLVSVLYAAFLIHYMTGDLAFLNQGVSDLKALVGGAR